jgi:hypothetical protein
MSSDDRLHPPRDNALARITSHHDAQRTVRLTFW